MKRVTLLLALTLISCAIFGQNNNHTANGGITERPAKQSVFAEYGGVSIFSLNYERRFDKYPLMGARAGMGYMSFFGTERYISMPVAVNWLLGRSGRYFEVGAGATLLANFSKEENSGSAVRLMGTLFTGYRYQPLNGGFQFRVGFSPSYISADEFVPFVFYLSFGYAW